MLIPGNILTTSPTAAPLTQICSRIRQYRLDTSSMVEHHSCHQWGVALLVLDVGVDPVVPHQQSHKSGRIQLHREHQRRPTVLVFFVDGPQVLTSQQLGKELTVKAQFGCIQTFANKMINFT